MINKLAIAIPTYNRCSILRYNLLKVLDDLIYYNIPVYISDDSTNDETKELIAELTTRHSQFIYRKNETQLGHDLNCIETISWPKEQFVWYLGDSIIIEEGAIKKLFNIPDVEEYDFICVNEKGRYLDVKSGVFCNCNETLTDLGWHLTMTSTTIYNKKKLFDLKSMNLTEFKNFPQTAIIFIQLAKQSAKLFWINEKLIRRNEAKKSYWQNSVFNVFFIDLNNFLWNLPSNYEDVSKELALKRHSTLSGIFSYKCLLIFRSSGAYNYNTAKKYKHYLSKYTDLNITLALFISVLPKKPLDILYKLLEKKNK